MNELGDKLKHPNIRLDFILATRNVLYDNSATMVDTPSPLIKRFKSTLLTPKVPSPPLVHQHLVSCHVNIDNVTNILSDHYPVSMSLVY